MKTRLLLLALVLMVGVLALEIAIDHYPIRSGLFHEYLEIKGGHRDLFILAEFSMAILIATLLFYRVCARQQQTLEELSAAYDKLKLREDQLRSVNCQLHALNQQIQASHAALLDSQSRYQKITANIPGVVYQFVIRPDGTRAFPFASEKCRDLIGVDAAAVQGDSSMLFGFVHPDDRASLNSSIEESARLMKPWSWNGRFLVCGTCKWLEGVAQPERQPDGSILFDGLIIDVTERKWAEKALQEGETRYKRLVESVTDYIYTVKVANGRAVSTTHGPACVAVTGYSLEEYQADPDLWFKMVHVDDRKSVLEQAQRLLSGQTVQPLEHRLIHKSGRIIWARNTAVPHGDEHGRLVSYDGLVTNITERKLAEEQLQEHARELKIINQELSAANRDKEILLNEIHHRVKNNLQVISSLLKLQLGHLRDASASAVIRECQNRIKAMAIVHEKLYQSRDLARIDLGEHIRSLVSHLFRSFLVVPDSIRTHLAVEPEVSLDIDQAIPCCLIINELVTNALKYAFPHNRGGEITIRLQSDGAFRRILAISDNGVGFPNGVDFRNMSSLGMQLVMTFVEQLKGTISLDAHQGTTFTIRFGGGGKNAASVPSSGVSLSDLDGSDTVE